MTWKINDIISYRNCLSQTDIGDYLQHNMAADARFELENHLLDCALCSSAVEGYIANPKELNTGQQRIVGFKRWLSTAATLAILLIGGIAIIKYYNANQLNRTFAVFYEKPTWDHHTRGGNESNSRYEQAIQNFNQGRYQAAIPILDSLLIINEENNQMRLYKGITHMELDQNQEAEDELTVVRINSDIYFEEATWYLALLNVKTENTMAANLYLDELLAIKDGFFYPKAAEMKKWLQK